MIWIKEPGIRLAAGAPGDPDGVGLVKPSLIELPDGRYRMLYVRLDGRGARILSAITGRAG